MCFCLSLRKINIKYDGSCCDGNDCPVNAFPERIRFKEGKNESTAINVELMMSLVFMSSTQPHLVMVMLSLRVWPWPKPMMTNVILNLHHFSVWFIRIHQVFSLVRVDWIFQFHCCDELVVMEEKHQNQMMRERDDENVEEEVIWAAKVIPFIHSTLVVVVAVVVQMVSAYFAFRSGSSYSCVCLSVCVCVSWKRRYSHTYSHSQHSQCFAFSARNSAQNHFIIKKKCYVHCTRETRRYVLSIHEIPVHCIENDDEYIKQYQHIVRRLETELKTNGRKTFHTRVSRHFVQFT